MDTLILIPVMRYSIPSDFFCRVRSLVRLIILEISGTDLHGEFTSLCQGGCSAMFRAAVRGHADIVSLLIEAHGIVDLCEKVISKELSVPLLQWTDKTPSTDIILRSFHCTLWWPCILSTSFPIIIMYCPFPV